MSGRIIGLTGPTGAGKSEAARALKAAGCAIADADQVSRKAVAEQECLQALAEAFGADILQADGTLNRRELARRAFASPEKEKLLNAITHPRILRYMEQEIRQALENGAPAVIVDAPLLFESGMDRICDTVLAVLAREAVRLQRICQRDGISESDGLLRIRIQPRDDFYIQRADTVFYNDHTPAELAAGVTAWFDAYMKKEAAHEG